MPFVRTGCVNVLVAGIQVTKVSQRNHEIYGDRLAWLAVLIGRPPWSCRVSGAWFAEPSYIGIRSRAITRIDEAAETNVYPLTPIRHDPSGRWMSPVGP